MTRGGLLLLIVPGGLIGLAAVLAWRRYRSWRAWEQQSYVAKIAVLKSDRPLTLPAVRTLKGVRIDRAVEKIAQFRR